jgi:DNA-binding CsgD family transcriptional regulator
LNPVAEELLRRGDGMFLSGGMIRCRDHIEDRRLGLAIEGIARKGLSEAHAVAVSRLDGFAPWTLTVLPLVSQDVFGRLRVAVLVDGPDLKRDGSLLSLAKACELTTAETDLLEALRRGQSMQVVASARNVSPHTVKTQKRSLFGKLEVHSDAQLMRRLAELGYQLSDRDETG